MTLREYVDLINEFVETNKEYLDNQVYTESGKTNSNFCEVVYGPSMCFVDDRGNVMSAECCGENNEECIPNAVFIN